MYADVQFGVHEAVFILIPNVSRARSGFLQSMANLSSSVDDFGEKRLAFVDDLMTKCILNRRVVTFDEVAFAILNSEGRFACAQSQPLVDHVTPAHDVPTERLPRIAIFRCFTEGAIVATDAGICREDVGSSQTARPCRLREKGTGFGRPGTGRGKRVRNMVKWRARDGVMPCAEPRVW